MKRAFIITAVLFLFAAMPAYAVKPKAARASAPETTYAVKKGDNLWRISKKVRISVDELKRLNGLDSNKLKPGQKLALKETAKASPAAAQVLVSEDIIRLAESPELKEAGLPEKLIFFAGRMLGTPYRFGGTTFMGIDCSAFVQKLFSLININLPRTAREQFLMGAPVGRESLEEGDLVFFRTYASFPSHVGLYIGDNFFIHASPRHHKVGVDRLDTPYYTKRFIGAKRMLAPASGPAFPFSEAHP